MLILLTVFASELLDLGHCLIEYVCVLSVCAHACIWTQDLEGKGLKYISEEGGSVVYGHT